MIDVDAIRQHIDCRQMVEHDLGKPKSSNRQNTARSSVPSTTNTKGIRWWFTQITGVASASVAMGGM